MPRISDTCWRFDSSSQVFCDEGYPFHAVRYLQHPKVPKCKTICLTLYSSSVPIRSGRGFEKFGLCALVSLQEEGREAWNTSCIFQVAGKQRW